MVKNWDDYRDIIIDLYQRQGLRLRDVMRIMEERHGFKASMRAYRQKFADWNIRKYRRHGATMSSTSDGGSLSSGASNSRTQVGQALNHTGRHEQDDQYLSPNQYRTSQAPGWSTTRSYMSTTTSPTSLSGLNIGTPESQSGHASFTSVYPQHVRSPSFSGTLSPIPHQVMESWESANSTGPGQGYGHLVSPVSMAPTTSPGQPPYSPSIPLHESFQSLYAPSPYGQDTGIPGTVNTTSTHGQSRTHVSPQGQHSQTFTPATPRNQLNLDYHHQLPQQSAAWSTYQQSERRGTSSQHSRGYTSGNHQEDIYETYRPGEETLMPSSLGSQYRRPFPRNLDARYMGK